MAWRQLLREKGAANAQESGSPPPRAKGKGKGKAEGKGTAPDRDARDAEIARRFGFKP